MSALPEGDRRARARRRRLVVLALGALERPVTAAELRSAFGEDLSGALEEAAELGYCAQEGDLFSPAGPATLEAGLILLGVAEAAAAVGRLVPLAEADPARAFLLALASDPAGEGQRRARALPEDPVAAALVALLDGEEPQPSAALGARARLVYAAVAAAAHGLLPSRPDVAMGLVRWGLGPEGLEGEIAPAQGLLAAVVTQGFYDLGEREEAIRFSRAAQARLGGRTSVLARLLLMILEGHVLADLHRLPEARQVFTKAELLARAEGLFELVGITRIAFGTLAFREGHTAAAVELFGSALELLAGSAGYERLALHCLAHAWAKQGRHLEARAALAETTPGLESLAIRLSGWANAIGYDAFFGDVDAGRQKLAALEREAADTPHARLAAALSRAWLAAAAGDWQGALGPLEASRPERAARPAFAVAMGCLEAGCLLRLGRVDEAAQALEGAARLHLLQPLSRHRALVHVLDAEVALARGDVERARRAVRRAEEFEASLRSFDFELRIRLVALELARRADGGPRGREAAARARADEAWRRLTAGFDPAQVERFRAAFDRPALLARLEGEGPQEAPRLPGFLGRSPALLALVDQLERVGPAEVDVLVLGETGAGKELCARALHTLSARREGPFVALNCAALTDELLLSELFGHEKGAFTGAADRYVGRFERAHGGTLFLDEIGEISPRGQAALLRALQERTFERVGGAGAIPADVRVVAATNRDLEAQVAGKEFREDLYYRLRGIQLRVPPLRDRREDIPLLARAFLQQAAKERGGSLRRLSEDAEAMLVDHPWPGNVRELRSALFAADLVADGDEVTAATLRALVEDGRARAPDGADAWYSRLRREGRTLREFLDDVERALIRKCVEANGGNLSAAAAELGLSRPRLSQIVHADPELRAWRRQLTGASTAG